MITRIQISAEPPNNELSFNDVAPETPDLASITIGVVFGNWSLKVNTKIMAVA